MVSLCSQILFVIFLTEISTHTNSLILFWLEVLTIEVPCNVYSISHPLPYSTHSICNLSTYSIYVHCFFISLEIEIMQCLLLQGRFLHCRNTKATKKQFPSQYASVSMK